MTHGKHVRHFPPYAVYAVQVEDDLSASTCDDSYIVLNKGHFSPVSVLYNASHVQLFMLLSTLPWCTR